MTNVFFLHGVGMWPGLFEPLVAPFPGEGFAPARPGYLGARDSGVDGFDAQLGGVRTLIADHGPGVLVGVSGGATIALAAAIERVDGVRGVLTHEPLVGPLVPELHERVVAGAADVSGHDPRRIDAFLRDLYGPAWADIDATAARWAERHRDTVAREVAQFASFAPSREALSAIAVPHVTTVGARSATARHEVADLLAAGGAVVRVVPECGHLLPLEAPAAFGAAVGELLALVERRS